MAQSKDVPQPADQNDGQTPARRSAAEWTTLGAVLLILISLIAALGWYALQPGEMSPIFEVRIDQNAIRQHGDAFYVPLEVHNIGRGTAEEVIVRVELSQADEVVEETDLTFSFVAGGETAEGVAVFTLDPASGELVAGVTSFLIP